MEYKLTQMPLDFPQTPEASHICFLRLCDLLKNVRNNLLNVGMFIFPAFNFGQFDDAKIFPGEKLIGISFLTYTIVMCNYIQIYPEHTS